MSNYYRRLKMHFLNYRARILIAIAAVILVVLAVWGMMSLESYYRNITLATMPLQMLMVAMNAIIFVYLYLIVLRGGFAKMDNKNVKGGDVNVRFTDVVGIDEAKEEAWEVVQLIKDHSRVKKIGGKILRGILMVGPPGCGKTYLAKAIATEAGLPFLSMSSSEFVEIFVGVGASRVRKLFKKARSLAYGFGGCVVFLDELDAIGRNRVFNQFGGGSETNTTQNQLLVEMDGLGGREENVIVIGATNASEDSLDPALLRPGRFDRKVYITRPGLEGREKLFQYYLGKVKHEASIDVGHLARKAVGKSPAEIENIIKEAALIATRNGKEVISYKEITEAIERIELGIKNKIKMQDSEKEMTAYHEAGHLVTIYLLHPTDDVFKASIIPRKTSLGVVHHQPREEMFSHDRDKLLADIKCAVAGYVAERIKKGVTTTGVSADFSNAMKVAHFMVWKLGMGPSGYIGDYTAIPENELSETVKSKLNDDTNKILKDCMNDVDELLKAEKVILERFAHELLVRQELEFDEIEAIFAEYGRANPRAFQKNPEGSTKLNSESEPKS
ncbi:MAG: AAA family ATPase [Candidatus Omnitrophica bacterium]|nr:AAA family ATPase [Candidatus Omnitrophota bacterium]